MSCSPKCRKAHPMTSKYKYAEIAHQLRTEIVNGTYPPGSTIPPLPKLMETYGVARDTVRDAVIELANQGLVISRRGVGTVVRDTAAIALGEGGPLRSWNEQTGGGHDEVISAERADADEIIADRLGVEKGASVAHRVRYFYKGESVAQITSQVIPEAVHSALYAEGYDVTNADERPDSVRDLFKLMTEVGHGPAKITERISTRMPSPDEREVMEIPPGTPVLVTVRVATAEDGTPVETTTAVGVGDRMSATISVPYPNS